MSLVSGQTQLKPVDYNAFSPEYSQLCDIMVLLRKSARIYSNSG